MLITLNFSIKVEIRKIKNIYNFENWLMDRSDKKMQIRTPATRSCHLGLLSLCSQCGPILLPGKESSLGFICRTGPLSSFTEQMTNTSYLKEGFRSGYQKTKQTKDSEMTQDKSVLIS